MRVARCTADYGRAYNCHFLPCWHRAMSPFKRHVHPDQLDDNDAPIDPDLRLRTVRTAASTIAESIRSELRAEKRKSVRRKRSLFFRKDKRPKTADSAVSDATTQIHGQRRNIYVNAPLSATELDQHGEPIARFARNKVRTSSESPTHSPALTPHTLQDIPCSHSYPRTSLSSSTGRATHPPCPRPFTTLYRIANIYFLALVIVQRECVSPGARSF